MIDEAVKKPKKKGIQYFTQDTEDAIILYNNTEDSVLRSKIYQQRIHHSFFKLTENIMHTFKFYYTEVNNIEDLQHEVIEFLLKKIHRFDPSRGAKAYSYFGTIAKRYLINENNKNYRKRVNKAPIDILETDEKKYLEQHSNQFLEYLEAASMDEIETVEEENKSDF